MAEKTCFDHEDEEGEDYPIADGAVEEEVLGVASGWDCVGWGCHCCFSLEWFMCVRL